MVSFFKRPFFSNYRVIFGLYFLVTLFVSIRVVFVDGSNNYQIFYYSLDHLIHGKSLYTVYPDEYTDHYHYAPTFAALFSPVFSLPYSLGLFLWHFLFAGIWVLAIYRMPFTHQQKVFAYWFGLQELFTSLVNSQTNPLIAAIPLFAFISFEKRQPFWAAFFIVLGFNIKIYSLVAGALFILYPQKIRFLISCLLWGVVLGLLPLIFTPFDKLLWQYDLWINQLFIKSDHDKWGNTSIHRLVHTFISPDVATPVIIGAGVILFCTVYAQFRRFTDTTFRLLMVASTLIFQVIFNPVAESPTYITAVTGVLIWWFCSPQTVLDRVLLIACLIFTIFSPSDLFPVFLREQFVKPYVLKALPCVLIWFRVIYLMHIDTNKSTHGVNLA
ncbi:glycosyltransferase family 87 protein [Spirosoma sp.]|uniref:glycosyltransferase family 87 protein n=1 Tax=Spirosoma sp. TaxID=1899569 RepID=UPI003B3B0061